MADEKIRSDQVEDAAAQRRREIERPEDTSPDPSGLFNPVEGVAPHRAGIPDRANERPVERREEEEV